MHSSFMGVSRCAAKGRKPRRAPSQANTHNSGHRRLAPKARAAHIPGFFGSHTVYDIPSRCPWKLDTTELDTATPLISTFISKLDQCNYVKIYNAFNLS